ncbi:hypothetical protein B0181_11175 [Moraxella caviae]|uniref:Proteophosphoglycan n=1 Tax=Moraxella caviae TaxID=34060 RepID=A0A1S9ZU89_9GAMM|nr:DUF1285 domain-containing protein [Moraxella caviae]OOR87072.1 hypothetical protein B0181_11175 [Moraxella caviae]VEW10624.1 Uncharacterized protein conserved in bacteria [Moraxella caviae]
MSLDNALLPFLKAVQNTDNPTGARRLPPVEKWSPKHTVPFNMQIRDNGEWWHDGTKMTRQSLVDLFASVLWVEVGDDGKKRHFLRTPSHQYEISVVDAPLLVVAVDVVADDGEMWLEFSTTHGDKIRLSKKNPLYFQKFSKDNGTKEERLYIDVRHHLTAKIANNVRYHLLTLGELCEQGDEVVLVLQSGGEKFYLAQKF